MAPRFAFHASKFRNIECKQLPREQSYDGLQVTTGPVDGNVLAATLDKFAFAHQIDGGGAIQIKLLSDIGKSHVTASPLLRGHQHRVNALAFSPFDPNVLASASADATVNIWRLPSSGVRADVRVPSATLRSTNHASVSGVTFHPSARNVVAFFAQRDVEISDIETQQSLVSVPHDDDVASNVCAVAWSYDGSVLATAQIDQCVCLYDPRAAASSNDAVQTATAHTGRRPLSVVWCGRLAHFVTVGSDRMHERELKLWDPRQLTTHVHRQRLDASTGVLLPLYDDDVNLLYLLGKGDRSVRTFEVDGSASTARNAVTPLDHTALANMTLAAALVPKQACDAAACEVARVLTLSASGVCDILRYHVPRKDASHTFQRDLFPDTKAFVASMSADAWRSGCNADPLLERIEPTANAANGSNASAVFGSASSWSAPAAAAASASTASTGASKLAAWGSSWSNSNATTSAPATTAAAPPSAAPVVPSGWGASTTAWSTEPAKASTPQAPAPAWKAAASVPNQPPQWQHTTALLAPDVASSPASTDADTNGSTRDAATNSNISTGLSDKARRLGAKYGHKFKYIAGKQATRNDVFHFGDRGVATSMTASPIIAASAQFWAAPLTGAGGPVLVNALDATGRGSSTTTVLNGHKAGVTDLAFSPFRDDVLATSGSDAVVQLWSVRADAGDALVPTQTLRGHSKSVRCVAFHPTASNVLCSTSLDLTLRLWDVEYGRAHVTLADKLDDMVWNLAFSVDGALLATASRDRIVRIFDPRQSVQALVAMGCGYDSAKPQFVTWVSDVDSNAATAAPTLVTLGVNARTNEKQLAFYDARNLVEPVAKPVTIETAASSVVHYPLYDASARLLLLVSMGDRHVQSYELDPAVGAAHANLPFAYAGHEPISGAALLPKQLCDVRNVEVDRLLLLTPSAVDCVSFSLPRMPTLRAYFQDDVYGLVPARRAALSATDWFAGANAAPVLESLQPDDMVPLSQKPVETAPVRPKTLDFQDRIRQEDAEKRLKAEQLERLNALAAQPTLHSVTRGQSGNVAASTALDSDSSDDEWDD